MSPHVNNVEVRRAIQRISAEAITDHGVLSGLADDDHPQYHDDTRADAWIAAGHETTYDHTAFLTVETDPVFAASDAAGISATDIGNWDTAYGWGDHAGLYDATGTASGLVGTHESTYDHSLIGAIDTLLTSGTTGQMLYADGTGYPSWTSKLLHNGTDFILAGGSSLIGTDFTSGYILYANATKEVTATNQIVIGATRPTFTFGLDAGYVTAAGSAGGGQLNNFYVPRIGDLTAQVLLDYQDDFAYIDKRGTATLTPSPGYGSAELLFRDDSRYVQYASGTSPGTEIVLEVIPTTPGLPPLNSSLWAIGVTFRSSNAVANPTHVKIETWNGSAYEIGYDADIIRPTNFGHWVSPTFTPAATGTYVVKLKLTLTIPNPLAANFRIQRVQLYHGTGAWDPWHLHVGGGWMYGNASFQDSVGLVLGTGSDATIKYDGTNLVINPKAVGSGIVDITGTLQVDQYNSSDGTAGATADVDVAKVGGGTRTIHFKSGLYTGYTDS